MPPKKKKDQAQVNNSLQEAIMGYNVGSIGSQINQVDTLYVNNRWYMVSNMRQVLSQAYCEHGLIQAVIDLPVDDAFRGGIKIESKQLSPENVKHLETYLEHNNLVSDVFAQSCKWNRLFGGAGIVILTDQDPTTPLDKEAINPNTKLDFRAVEMWELFWDKQSTEGYDQSLQEHDYEFYNYYGIKLHKSRVLKMKGLTAPSFIRPRLRGWGMSVIEIFVSSINQFLKSKNLTFEVLDEFKVDVFKIKGLATTLLSAGGVEQVQKRVALANMQKNFQNALTMDGEDDYDHKELSFGGISEVMKELRIQIASDLRIPMTKLFGISASGFNSGEDDIENYNSMVESQVRQKAKFHILNVIKLICQHEFGFMPDDLEIDFKPLRILSEDQEEAVKSQRFARLLQARQAGEVTSMEFREGCNVDNLLPIKLAGEIDEVKEAETDTTQG